MRKFSIVKVLDGGWEYFNRRLGRLTEAQLNMLLAHELENNRRASYIDRIHKRINSRRFEREKIELQEKRSAAANDS